MIVIVNLISCNSKTVISFVLRSLNLINYYLIIYYYYKIYYMLIVGQLVCNTHMLFLYVQFLFGNIIRTLKIIYLECRALLKS